VAPLPECLVAMYLPTLDSVPLRCIIVLLPVYLHFVLYFYDSQSIHSVGVSTKLSQPTPKAAGSGYPLYASHPVRDTIIPPSETSRQPFATYERKLRAHSNSSRISEEVARHARARQPVVTAVTSTCSFQTPLIFDRIYRHAALQGGCTPGMLNIGSV
jgi:hypothetical protein